MERILVLDDDRAHGAVVGEILEQRFEVFVTDEPEEALAIARQIRQIHAIISDFEMPAMNGVEVLKLVKQIAQDARRILMSARFSNPGFDHRTVSEAEAHVLLPKPITVKALREAVEPKE